MTRLTLVFSSLFLIAVWSAPIDAAAEQGRARRRESGTTQAQRAPQRSAPARRAPVARQQRGAQNGGSARRAAPRRAPRPSGSGRVERGGNAQRRQVAPPTNVRGDRVAPSTGGTTVGRRAGRAGGRNTRIGRAGGARQGATQVDRRPPRGRVVGTATRRPPLSSRPIVVNNYGGRGYTRYGGRHRYGAPHIYGYGSPFYAPGYNFSIGFGVGYGSGYYGSYGYGRYGRPYGDNPYAYRGYADAYYTGSLRLKIQPRFGEVLVDGYYVGLVNDFDGVFQRLRLEEGPHHIEVHEPGFEPLELEVLILPGETITYEGYLIPLP